MTRPSFCIQSVTSCTATDPHCCELCITAAERKRFEAALTTAEQAQHDWYAKLGRIIEEVAIEHDRGAKA